MAKILVGCKLPNGLKIEHGGKEFVLDGANKDERASNSIAVVIHGDMYGVTEVDDVLWAAWSKEHKDFAPLKNGSIFAVKDKASVKAAGKDVEKAVTGFEAQSKEVGDLKSADKD